MATPTITTVSPSIGHSAGSTLLEVIGTGFQLPFDPPASGPVPYIPPSVRVFLGDVEAQRVDVISATRMFVLTAPHDLPPGQDELRVAIEVRNVGREGETLGAEVGTLANAYTYARPKLDQTSEGNEARTIRALIRWLKRGALEEVVLTTNVDFSDDPNATIRKLKIAKLPAICLIGPTHRKNGLQSTNVERTTVVKRDADGAASEILRTRVARTVDLVFGISIVADGGMLLAQLMESVTNLVERDPFLKVQREPGGDPTDLVKFEVRWEPGGDLQADTQPNESNIVTASGNIAILAFPITNVGRFERDMGTTQTPTFEGETPLQIEIGTGPG